MDDESSLPESIREHIAEVRAWLEENVEVYATPDTVTLDEFEFKDNGLSGSFRITLDQTKISDRFSYGYDQSGKPKLYFPMFHSPLGAPASYAAVELTGPTTTAIEQLLRSQLPRLKPLGLDSDTGQVIAYHSPLEMRKTPGWQQQLDATKGLSALKAKVITEEE